jgi:RNA polymerase sigma factor (sigma-70 family)
MGLGPLEPGAEHALRELAPRVLGAVVRRCGDFAAAEDAVQEALISAASDWPQRGLPQNPAGWLFHVACRRLADQLDAERSRRGREDAVAQARSELALPQEEFDELYAATGDDALVLLFTCCHPALTPASAIALTLRAVGGLTTAEIAGAFLVPEPTMAQRIARAKETIRDSGVPFALPEPHERAQRLDAVLHVLYLIFDEGYVSRSGPDLVRVDLSNEAIRLARALHRLLPDHAETAGLLALLLLTEARRPARVGPEGELIPLHEQDRALWDRAAIAEGKSLLAATIARKDVGSYGMQAAIASLHDEARSFADTDWPQILVLYGMLLARSDNPMVALNRAVALAMVHGPSAGLEIVRELEADRRLAGNFRLGAVRAHLLEMSGEREAAVLAYRAAAAGTTNHAEQHYLLSKAARLEAR